MALKKAPAGYLIDTCIWVELERGRLSAADLADIVGEAAVYLSPVSIAELSMGAEMAEQEHVRTRRRETVRRLASKVAMPIDSATGEVYGLLAAKLIKAGRGSPSHRIQDLWIAAQSIQHRLRLITYNRKDFDDVPGLDVQVLRQSSRG